MEHESIRYPIGRFKPAPSLSLEERSCLIRQIPAICAQLRTVAGRLAAGQQFHIPYRPGGWTAQQIVHHLADNDMNAYLRFKRALTEEEPAASSYREDLWAQLSDYRDVPVETSITLLEALHSRFVVLLDGLQPEDFQKTLTTGALGTITLDTALQRFIWHNRHHIAQIQSLPSCQGIDEE